MRNKLLLICAFAPAVAIAGAPGAGHDLNTNGVNYADDYMTAPPALASHGWAAIDVVVDTLVPRDDNWQISMDEAVSGRSVTWTGEGKPWKKRLQDIGASAGIPVAIDDSTKRIHIGHARPSGSALSAQAGATRSNPQAGSAGRTHSNPPQSVQQGAASEGNKRSADQLPTAPFMYTLDTQDGTLSRAVERWANTAGWTIDWRATQTDYPIASRAEFEGDFKTAMAGLFTALAETGSSLGVSFATNRHAVVNSIK